MTKNDILRRLRYILDFNDHAMIDVFALGQSTIDREQLCNWLRKDDEPGYCRCEDSELASFLNGLISHRRGVREGEQPQPEHRLNNNLIFRKLRIAFDLKDTDIIELLQLANFRISKSELGAFFRKTDHKHYRECQNQVLRHFLNGLQIHFRPSNKDANPAPEKKPASDEIKTTGKGKPKAKKPAKVEQSNQKETDDSSQTGKPDNGGFVWKVPDKLKK